MWEIKCSLVKPYKSSLTLIIVCVQVCIYLCSPFLPTADPKLFFSPFSSFPTTTLMVCSGENVCLAQTSMAHWGFAPGSPWSSSDTLTTVLCWANNFRTSARLVTWHVSVMELDQRSRITVHLYPLTSSCWSLCNNLVYWRTSPRVNIFFWSGMIKKTYGGNWGYYIYKWVTIIFSLFGTLRNIIVTNGHCHLGCFTASCFS